MRVEDTLGCGWNQALHPDDSALVAARSDRLLDPATLDPQRHLTTTEQHHPRGLVAAATGIAADLHPVRHATTSMYPTSQLGVAKPLQGHSSHRRVLPRGRRVTVARAPPAPATRSTSVAWPVSLGPWRELLSGVTMPGGPTAPADQLAREPHALLVRA